MARRCGVNAGAAAADDDDGGVVWSRFGRASLPHRRRGPSGELDGRVRVVHAFEVEVETDAVHLR